jgi:hypothetical protein
MHYKGGDLKLFYVSLREPYLASDGVIRSSLRVHSGKNPDESEYVEIVCPD